MPMRDWNALIKIFAYPFLFSLRWLFFVDDLVCGVLSAPLLSGEAFTSCCDWELLEL